MPPKLKRKRQLKPASKDLFAYSCLALKLLISRLIKHPLSGRLPRFMLVPV